ncbi:Concanavalin A-like lectin/glucanase superfamily [Artemisia annua]|uniref:Concanavalin A-like lectin/glucanase superfamily n=1 Tax=Artemisia annua TaxID=35608 RepID=A0A2U1N436_ARTAN|nr:Concanavalin A-like lectin/glucanase superfamily [Artemisia annua]
MDIDSENMLLKGSMTGHIIVTVPVDASFMVVGTNGYATPKYVQTGRLTAKIDVWRYDIFLTELMVGQRPLAKKPPGNKPECMRWVCYWTGVGKLKPVVDPRLEGILATVTNYG